jgi:hypothetical protein
MSYEQVCQTITKGDDAQVPRATLLLEKMLLTSNEVPVRQWVASPMGAYPVVPDFLSGMPTPMRVIEMTEDDSTPLKVWVDITSSAGVSLEELEARGIAILALILKLQTVRPVDLVLCCGTQSENCGLVIHWPTRPLDLATTCFALSNGAFARYAVYGLIRQHTGSYLGGLLGSVEAMREFFFIPEKDLVVPSAHLFDEVMRTDPVKWVNQQLEKYGVASEC